MQLQGWNKVNYLGRIPHEKVKDIYNKSFAGVLLSKRTSRDEGILGIQKFSVYETGLPVICSDIKI